MDEPQFSPSSTAAHLLQCHSRRTAVLQLAVVGIIQLAGAPQFESLYTVPSKDLVVKALDGPFLVVSQFWLQIASLPSTHTRSP